MKNAVLFVYVFLLSMSVSNAQDFQLINAPVDINGNQLANAWAGGLNCPQPSAVDLNNDGAPDLYLFDRVGDVHLTFLKQAAGYVFAPEFATNFPKAENWVLLRDYDGDGIADLFAYPTEQLPGIMVYKGYFDANNRLDFQRVHFDNFLGLDVLTFPLQGGGEAQIYVSNVDYPAVDDMDCDGDLDILTFNSAGGYVELYDNRSIEQGFGRDSLIFQLAENCWGGIYESGLAVNNLVDLSATLGACYSPFGEDDGVEVRHAGSTLLTYDANGDGDKELILGDLSFDRINFLTNSGTCQEAWITQQDPLFPSYDISADVATFPAAFYLDVTDDGKPDLLVAPNSETASEDVNAFWLYENTGTTAQPVFQYQQPDFLIDGMVDVGSGARPVLVDYNADGLLDIVVGNGSRYKEFGAKDPRLFLFENQGTPTEPHWVLVNDDYLGMNQYSQASFNFAPVFGDLDDDGDLDLLVGEQNGKLFYAQNTAGPGQPFQFANFTYAWSGIAVGQSSVPFIVDLNRDGLPDLLIGEYNGNINFFPNTGTPTQSAFNGDPSQSPNNFFVGQVDTRIQGFSYGHSSPAVLDINGQYKLFAGTTDGRIEVYSNIDGNLGGAFALDTEHFGDLKLGNRTHIAFGDVNNDGWLDALVGNYRGGLTLVSTDIPTGSVVKTNETPYPNADWANLWPNPAYQSMTIQLNRAWKPDFIEIRDVTGLVRKREPWIGPVSQSIDLQQFGAGIYFVRLLDGTQSLTLKLVKH
ncbi:MAG: T9SS type A sorting domain-containing protein [Saprospiraceae bacterium]|nr:T9SS type A sorting domain-containing protein [Saprospiraceae bacterium]